MSIVWVLGVTLSVAALVFGAPAMLFVRDLRPLAKWVAIASLVAAVFCHARYKEALNTEAIAAGFSNIEDRRTAQDVGFTDPEAWRMEKRARVEAQMASAAAERAQRAEKDAKRAALMAQIAADNEAACSKNLKCTAEKAWPEAASACEKLVERSAKYQFEWTSGFMSPKFTNYRWRDANQAQVTFYGDQIKMQNGFGAWQHMTYYCDYDTKSKAVLDLRMIDGRL